MFHIKESVVKCNRIIIMFVFLHTEVLIMGPIGILGVTSSMQIPLMQSVMCECTTSMLFLGHQHFLSKACRLNIIQLFVETRQANNIMDVPFVLAKFDDLLIHYYSDYQIEALSDASLKAALRALIPAVLRDIVKDVIMFRSILEDDLSVVDLRGIITELIAGPFMRH